MLDDVSCFPRLLMQAASDLLSSVPKRQDRVGNPFAVELSVEGDPIWGTSLRDLARIAAQILLYTEHEGASGLFIDCARNTIVCQLGGARYNMVGPPAPCFVDLIRTILKATNTQVDQPGALTLPLTEGHRQLRICYEQHPTPCMRITGFRKGES